MAVTDCSGLSALHIRIGIETRGAVTLMLVRISGLFSFVIEKPSQTVIIKAAPSQTKC